MPPDTRLAAVDAEKARLDAARPLSPHTVASLREKLMLEWTYHSNAIEGNTLTLRPFVDGNGRTGRLLLNLELMKSGYPPAVIRKEDRLAYYDALDEACLNANHDAITALVADSVLRSLRLYLDLLPASG
ncbi:Fic family protein [Herbaspirillum rubrisubalbicans]|uniref:Fido domain-containing protein n=1 Tax=Herbaspirillum rubrisubalbicans TaxID=80842 RepID=A0AAD0XIQ3_9BURK|nr:Fic family protein [Herbaspirillum rubrisubalbicans]AYR26842.1 hypothetical protein RC54_24770 [Herbaspirillum rubrisubalbicans]